ncbi:MAG: ABC transporter permease subunit, partial [Deltaproteobacteria bacterium]|nr:ABC transporter permease subunit [Deltaproteobacteria bacterium]
MIEAGSDWFPYGMDVHPATGNTTSLTSARTTNYCMRTFEVLDWSVIVRYVMSFLCIVLSYNAISGERESGALRLALANPLSRAQFLSGKFLAHLVTLIVALVLGSLISLAILALNQVLELNGLVAINYLFFLVSAMFYIALFLLLGMGISAIARTSATSLVVLIMSWTVLTVVIPQTSYLIAVHVVEPPGFYWERLDEYESQFRETMERDGVALRQPELARTDGYALEMSYAVRLREMEGGLDRLMRDVEAQNFRQFEVTRGVNLLSPGFAFQYAVEALLGTGILRLRSFATQANQYRGAVREFLRARDAADPDSPHVLFVPEFMSDKPLEHGDIPRFRLQPLSFADGLAAAVVPITILILEAAMAFF